MTTRIHNRRAREFAMKNLDYGQLSRLTLGPRTLRGKKTRGNDIGRAWARDQSTHGRREYAAWVRTNFTAGLRLRLRGDTCGWLYNLRDLKASRRDYAPWLYAVNN